MEIKIPSEEILKIFDKLEESIFLFDENKKVLFFNTKAKETFNLKEDILGKDIEEFLKFPDLKYLFYLLEKEKEIEKKEIEIREDLVSRVTSFPMADENKKMKTFLILDNITKEREAEKMKTYFATIASHQLRTPISGIKWIFETLLKNENFNQEEQKSLLEGLKLTQKISFIIDQLLTVVKIDEGKFRYKFTSENIEKIVKTLIESYQREIEKKQLLVEVSTFSSKFPSLKIDREKISLVIEILLDNAIRYTPPNGIISINLSANREFLFSIKDTGIGIPENEKENIFKKFFRASNAIKMETEGNGLGLYIAKKIIENHQGKIWFESKEGKGTIFYFSLPIKK